MVLSFAPLLCLCAPAEVAAQTADAGRRQAQGGFSSASFEAAFRKYLPPDTPFSPFYSWDAHMSLDVALFRKGPGTVRFTGTFQTIGTENLGSKVSVGGTGYILGLAYAHAYSDELTLSSGYVHLSSHLTRDLDDKIEEETNAGEAVPTVVDPHEYNVFVFGLYKKVPAWPLAPELEMIVTPVNFRFTGSEEAGYVRPVFFGTRFTLWRGAGRSLVASTQHEIGKNGFSSFSLALYLYPGPQQDGRLQIFASATPGQNLHVSPILGANRGGIAFGLRMRFRE